MGRKGSKKSLDVIPFRTLEEDIVLALKVGIPLPLIGDLFNTSFTYARSVSYKHKLSSKRRNIIWDLCKKEEQSTYDLELEMQRGGTWNGKYPWQLRPGDYYED